MSSEALKADSARRLLFLEDDDVLRERMARTLSRAGFSIDCCRSLEETKVRLAENTYDCGLFDLRIGNDTSLALVSELRRRSPGATIVILTGYGTVSAAVDAMQRGAATVLTKPIESSRLIDALRGIPTRREHEGSAIPTLEQIEWEHLQRVLSDHQGNLSHTAKALGMHRRSLQRKLMKIPKLR